MVLHDGLSGKLFPIHLKPKDDELLSSWLTRLASAHGLTPDELSSFLVPQRKESLWRQKDIDLRLGMDERKPNIMHAALLIALSERCATPLSMVKKTTLDEYDGRLYNKLFVSKLYSWITPHELLPTARRLKRFGMQACPRCLAEDDIPYFRRRWRIAFVTTCPRHQSLLIDRCSACGAPILFHKSVAGLTHAVSNTITICYECRFDLRNAKTQPLSASEVSTLQEQLIKIAEHERVSNVKGNKSAATGEYFKVLHWMLRITTHWHSFARKLQKAIFTCYGFEPHMYNFPKEDSLESLDVSRRYELMGLLCRLQIDHPSKYLLSSYSRDLMCRIWFNKWLSISSGYSFMLGVERNEHDVANNQINVEQVNALMGYHREKPNRRTETEKYGLPIRTDELKRAALQLFSDGISTLHIAGILNVARLEACEWIKEHSHPAEAGRQAKSRVWAKR